MKDNARVLDDGGNPSVSKEAVRKMEEELPVILEYFAVYAQMVRAKFDELVKQGFTEPQALELCRILF